MMKRLGITRVDIRRVAPDCRSGSPGGVRGRERHGGERIGRPKASVRGPHRANGYYRSPQTIRGVLCSEGRRATSALLWPAFNRISISCRFSTPNILLSLRRRTLLDTVVCCHLVHCFAAMFRSSSRMLPEMMQLDISHSGTRLNSCRSWYKPICSEQREIILLGSGRIVGNPSAIPSPSPGWQDSVAVSICRARAFVVIQELTLQAQQGN